MFWHYICLSPAYVTECKWIQQSIVVVGETKMLSGHGMFLFTELNASGQNGVLLARQGCHYDKGMLL